MKKRFMGKYDSKKHDWFKLTVELVVVVVVAFLLFRFVIGFSTVRGVSMLPTFEDGDIAVYTRIVPEFERGDILSVRMPSGEYYVKRVIAVEGDTVDIENGKVLLNGEVLDEEYVKCVTEPDPEAEIMYPYKVERGKVFVMGDNRPESMDSRAFGAVVRDQIKGKILITF